MERNIVKKSFKLIFLVILLASSFLLASCGKSAEPASSSEMSSENKIAVAEKAVGGQYSELESVIGPASDSRHAARCGTNGEDYEYFYDGFSVLTYKEGESEVVEEVAAEK